MNFFDQGTRWVKLVVTVFIFVVGGYIGACWYIFNSIVTPERRQLDKFPSEMGFPNTLSLSFYSQKNLVLLKGWLVPSIGDRAIVLVHGIHSHAWDCQAPYIVRAYTDAGFNVLLFDLRGHGKSGGDRIGLGWLERWDVRAAVDLLLARGFEPGKIGIHGTSYGAATAILAAKVIPEIGAVIADSAFSNLLDMIGGEIQRQTGFQESFLNVFIPGINFLAYWQYGLDLNEISPEQAIDDIQSRPILLIHGTEDPIIPVEHALRLKKAAGSQAKLWLLPGLQHTEGVLLVPDCEKSSPMRDAFLDKVTKFFVRSL